MIIRRLFEPLMASSVTRKLSTGAVLDSNLNPNPKLKTHVGVVHINHRLSQRTHNLHQTHAAPQGFD